MSKMITLSDIAGYATERAVWQMMLDLSACDSDGNNAAKVLVPEHIIVADNHFLSRDTAAAGHGSYRAFSAPEFFAKDAEYSAASVIWTIGALAFYAITGTHVFEGKGGQTQTKDTEIPRLSSAHASRELSSLVHRCLSYMPADRPAKKELQEQAQAALGRPVLPRKRLSGHTGKSYGSSLIKFWPEEMIPVIILCLLLLMPTGISAQNLSFDRAAIPDEMASLVLRCTDLRLPQNADKVRKAMDRDMRWTMMDELPIDKTGECTTLDAVDMFGLNDMGFSILKRHGGVTNAGGRFRDGRDPRYKFSFLEITVKQGKEVNYDISGREGAQMFAIVPYDKDAAFTCTVENKGEITIGQIVDGVCYILPKQGLKQGDTIKLTLKNKSGKNMAFAIINYNSRNNE